MAHRIPIFKDDLSFAERQSKVWSNMERDMERRRREWEDEIERMRKDFFTLKPSEDRRLETLSDKFKMGDSLVDEARGLVEKDQNGLPVFRARFNVQTYTPDEVNVKIDANKLIVHAKHEEKSDNKSVSREYSREIDIPREIDPIALQCSISTDGILTVEAPMPVPNYGGAIKNGNGRSTPKENVIQSSTTTSVSTPPRNTPPPQTVLLQQQSPPPQQPPQQQSSGQQTHSSTFTTFLSGNPPQQPKLQPTQTVNASPQTTPVQASFSQSSPSSSSSFSTIHESDRKFKVDVDIEDFAPEELSVKTVDRKLVISARREEKVGNRTSTKELNREIYLPDTVDPYTVKAFFSDNGKLIVEAPYIRSVPVAHSINMTGR